MNDHLRALVTAFGAAALGLSGIVGACAGDEQTSTSSGATGGMGGGAPVGGMGGAGGGMGGMGGEGGMACVEHDNDGEAIALTQVALAFPTPTGGPIPYGTYHLVEFSQYTGPGGAEGPTGSTWKETSVWTAVDMRTALERNNDTAGERRIGFAYDLLDGTGRLELTVLCPEPLQINWDSYSADAMSITLFSEPLQLAWRYELVQ